MFQMAVTAVLVTMVLTLARAWRGPTVYDRILAVNSFGTATVLFIAVHGFLMGRPDFLDLALLYALINFIGTFAIVRYFLYGNYQDPGGELKTMAIFLDVLSWALLAVGSLFCVIGGLGLIRMPGFYSRVHASGLTDTMGAGCILIGLTLQAGISEVTTKLIIILGFLLITSPTAAHALVNGAYTHGLRPRIGDTEGES